MKSLSPTPRSRTISQAHLHVEGLCQYAYNKGFHELGYDPVKVLREAVEAQPSEIGTPYDQAALDEASRQLHMSLLREGSSYGTKACEEMGRVFMTAYRKALAPSSELTSTVAPIVDVIQEAIEYVEGIRAQCGTLEDAVNGLKEFQDDVRSRGRLAVSAIPTSTEKP